MTPLQHLQKMSGIPINENLGERYIFADVDPQSGEYHEIARGDLNQILTILDGDKENSGLAEVLRSMSANNTAVDQKGNRTFPHDGYIYLLLKA